jgi:hypothetical protein
MADRHVANREAQWVALNTDPDWCELPAGATGYEFYTNVPPSSGSAPGSPSWLGVRGQDWYSIDVTITKVNR